MGMRGFSKIVRKCLILEFIFVCFIFQFLIKFPRKCHISALVFRSISVAVQKRTMENSSSPPYHALRPK